VRCTIESHSNNGLFSLLSGVIPPPNSPACPNLSGVTTPYTTFLYSWTADSSVLIPTVCEGPLLFAVDPPDARVFLTPPKGVSFLPFPAQLWRLAYGSFVVECLILSPPPPPPPHFPFHSIKRSFLSAVNKHGQSLQRVALPPAFVFREFPGATARITMRFNGNAVRPARIFCFLALLKYTPTPFLDRPAIPLCNAPLFQINFLSFPAHGPPSAKGMFVGLAPRPPSYI